MNLLLDTNIIIGILEGDSRLIPPAAREILSNATLHYSVAVIWEVSIKHSTGKLAISPMQMFDMVKRVGMIEKPIATSHTLIVSTLNPIHRDPFDRIQIAQAIGERLTLVTADNLLPRYDSTGNVVRHISSVASKS